MRQHQIRLSPFGLWHRRLAGNGHTACGETIAGAYASREAELDLDICPLCFSKFERDTGKMKKLMRELEEEDPSHYFAEDFEVTPTEEWIPNDHEREEE